MQAAKIKPADLTAVMAVHYPNRGKYLHEIVEAMFCGTLRPERLILWCNDIDWEWAAERIPDFAKHWITYIESSDNDLLGRWSAILLARTPFVFVQDDDLAVGRDTVRLLVEEANHSEKSKYRICGVAGRNMNRFSEDPYTEGEAVYEGAAEMVLGRCFAAHRSALSPFFRHVLGGRDPGRCDDIMAGLLASNGCRVVKAEFKNFDEEGVGLCWAPEHFPERNAFAQKMLEEKLK